MKFYYYFGKNKKCTRCGGKPTMHMIAGMFGLVCRKCSPRKCKVYDSMVLARKRWNKAN